VTAFTVDPEVMARIRPMERADVGAVASLHLQSMGRSTWARLGRGFLEALYLALCDHPSFCAFVYVDEGGLGGFIAGTDDGPRLMRETFRRHPHRLVPPLVAGLARRPGLLGHLLSTPLYFRRSRPASEVRAESFFCSFEPHLRGRRISGHANKVLFDELLARGCPAVRITTEVDNPAAARQLRSWGFSRQGTFGFYGKTMAAWILDLEQSPRVEPVRRGGTSGTG